MSIRSPLSSSHLPHPPIYFPMDKINTQSNKRICLLLVTSFIIYHNFSKFKKNSFSFDDGRDRKSAMSCLGAASLCHELIPTPHSSEHTLTSIMNSNSSMYKWIGDQWVPPDGVPIFTPLQMRDYFSSRNVLFIGDSTARRLAHTLFAMFNASDYNDISKRELDDGSVINFHKDSKRTKTQCNKETRSFLNLFPQLRASRYSMPIFSLCRDWFVENDGSISFHVHGDEAHSHRAEKIQHNVNATNKFDYYLQNCYQYISWYFRDNQEANQDHLSKIVQEYDIVIIAMGIWELSDPQTCIPNNAGFTDPKKKMLNTLQVIKRNLPNNLRVIFRNSGFDQHGGDEHNELIWNFTKASKQFFYDMEIEKKKRGNRNYSTVENFSLLDFASVISKRSYDFTRIEAMDDRNPVHYGLAGRTLALQQMMHELVKADLINRQRGYSLH